MASSRAFVPFLSAFRFELSLAERYRHKVMIRSLTLLIGFLTALAGCATSTVPAPSSHSREPRVNSAYRTLAAHAVGKTGDALKSPPDRDVTARIQLEPTPGALQRRKVEGQYYGEVLTSGPYSDGYITAIQWVPVTRYFEVLRPVKCDIRMWVTLVNPKMIQANPAYVSGMSRDQDPVFGCEKHFHERYATGEDAELSDADGVLIDQSSLQDLGDHGPFINQMHIGMDAWAVRFVEPTVADVRERLTSRAVTSIDVLQLRAAAYWIVKHRRVDLVGDITQALPKAGTADILYGWNQGQIDLIKALAGFNQPGLAKLWLDILEGGALPDRFGSADRPTVVRAKNNDHAVVAANALACVSLTEHKQRLQDIMMHASRLPHKTLAAKLLLNAGFTDAVDSGAAKAREPARALLEGVLVDRADVPVCAYTQKDI